MDSTKFDDILMGILQHCEQVEPFLDSIFSFLARRTDFFRVMQNRDDKMGFPPGVAEKIVLKIFKTYQQIVLGSSGDLEKGKNTSVEKKKKNKTGLTRAPLPETNAEESKIEGPSVASTVEIVASSSDMQPETPPSTAAAETVGETTAARTAVEPYSTSSENSVRPLQKSEVGKEIESQGLTPGKSDECYNGAVLDTYTWSQSIRDIDVRIPVPSSVTKARDVGVEIKCSHLKVWLKKDGANEVILDGKLQRTIKCEDSLWTLEPGKCILVNLEKTEERFWTAVLEGDLEIDKTRVDTTRDISDFDEQTQTDFQRVMYDHHQKLQGKPTSQEVKTHELLKQAWNAKGSPFAGTEFDPSKVNISPSYR